MVRGDYTWGLFCSRDRQIDASAGPLCAGATSLSAAAVVVLVQRSLLWVRAWSRLVMGCLRLAPRRAGIADEGSVL